MSFILFIFCDSTTNITDTDYTGRYKKIRRQYQWYQYNDTDTNWLSSTAPPTWSNYMTDAIIDIKQTSITAYTYVNEKEYYICHDFNINWITDSVFSAEKFACDLEGVYYSPYTRDIQLKPFGDSLEFVYHTNWVDGNSGSRNGVISTVRYIPYTDTVFFSWWPDSVVVK